MNIERERKKVAKSFHLAFSIFESKARISFISATQEREKCWNKSLKMHKKG